MLATSEATNASLVIAILALDVPRLVAATQDAGQTLPSTLLSNCHAGGERPDPYDPVGIRWGQGRPVRSAAPLGSSWQGGSLPKPRERRAGTGGPVRPCPDTKCKAFATMGRNLGSRGWRRWGSGRPGG